jgi:hypothetical protein
LKQVLKLLSDNATSTPQSLGDARKESVEELQSRHECVLAATCAVLGSIVKNSKNAVETLNSAADASSATSNKQVAVEQHAEILEGCKSLLNNASFLKTTLQSKSPLVRRNAYNLIASICHTAPEMVSDDESTLALFSPLVFGCLGEKESGNHSPMWDMVLSFASCSSSWSEHVNLSKAVLPKLWSLLRHGCYGSAEGSYPAVLPFINLIVQNSTSSLFGYNGFESLLSAVWDGLLSLVIGSEAQTAAANCFSECYLYAILKAEQLAGVEKEGEASSDKFCKDLTAAVIEKKCLVNAVGGACSAVCSSILVKIITKLAEHARTNAHGQRKLDIFIGSIGAATAEATSLALENLNAPGAPSLAAIEKLLLGIKTAVGESEEGSRVSMSTARPVVAALMPCVHSSTSSSGENAAGASTAAAALVASLVKAMPALNIASAPPQLNDEFASLQIHQSPSFTVESIVSRVIEEKQSGPALQASCDLIVSCLLQQEGPDAADSLSTILMDLHDKNSPQAALALLSQYISSAPEEKLAATRSEVLSDLLLDLVEEVEYTELCILLLVGNGTTTSLIDETTQGLAFDQISEAIEVDSVSNATYNTREIECGLRIITRTVFSAVICSTTDEETLESRQRAVCVAFSALVSETCEEAFERLAVAQDKDQEVVDIVSDSDSELDEDTSSKKHENQQEHSAVYNLAFALWSMPDKIAELLQQRAGGNMLFAKGMAQCIYENLKFVDVPREPSGLRSPITIKACEAAAKCTKMALDAIPENLAHVYNIFLHSIREYFAGYSFCSLFFTFLGEAVGWPRLLTLLGIGSVRGELNETSVLVADILHDPELPVPKRLLAALVEKPFQLEAVMKELMDERYKLMLPYSAISELLCAAFSSSNEDAIDIAASTFRKYSATVYVSHLFPMLEALAPILRSSEQLLTASGLPELSQKLCRQAIDTPEKSSEGLEFRKAAYACFPAPSVAPPVPKWALSTFPAAAPAAAAPSFAVGDLVWYRHRDGSWEASEVNSIDISIEPPSFAVKLATGVRETESGRLVARNDDDSPPLPLNENTSNSGGAGSGYTFDASSGSNTNEFIPTCCLDEEKHALLELFRSRFPAAAAAADGNEETPMSSVDGCTAAISCSALAWCSSEFTQADWEVVLTALHVGMDAVAVGAAAAAVKVATVITEEAENVAGAALGGAESSLAFFRQLHLKGVLEASPKGAAAAEEIADCIYSSLADFSENSALQLTFLLQSYCTASKLIATTARSCPITTWESSQAGVCAAVLDTFISLGKIVALAGGCGQDASMFEDDEDDIMGECLEQLSQVVDATVAAADRAFLAVVVERAGARRVEDGVGCTEALVALSLNFNTPENARNAAYRSILLHPELVLDIVRSAGADDDDAALLESGGAPAAAAARKDWYEELESGGLLPDIATVASDPEHPCFTTAWGFIASFLLHSPDSSIARTKLVESIKEAHGVVHAVLDDVLPLLPLGGTISTPGGGSQRRSLGGSSSNSNTAIFGAEDTSAQGFSHRLCALGVPSTTNKNESAHAALLYAGMLRALPVLCRLWYGDLRDRSLISNLEKYTSVAVSAGLLSAEYAAVDEMVKGLDRFEKFSVRANSASREVVASMEVEDGHLIELIIKLPASMPLKAPEAECKRSVGVNEAQLRKWLLSITAFLRNRNGAIADALRLWKRNVDTEFEGHDDCLICYSIIQPSTGQLPKLGCRTCKKKYHGTCLYKWFHSSGKSNCPHCQSPW